MIKIAEAAMTRALGIVAGPRKGQLTDRLTDSVLKGLSDKGAAVDKIYLADLSIKPCRGCLACQKKGKCVIEDDFRALADKFCEADIAVFSSPTYFSNVSSSAKAFFDRGYSLFKETPFGIKYSYKKPAKVVLITSCGAPFPFSYLWGISTGSVHAMKAFFGWIRARIKIFTITGAKDFNDKLHAKILKRAYEIGKNI